MSSNIWKVASQTFIFILVLISSSAFSFVDANQVNNTKIMSSIQFLSETSHNDYKLNEDYTWIWQTYENAPGDIQTEDIVFWGESMGPYHNYTEVTDKLYALESNFPGYIDLFSIGKSTQGRELWAVKLTDEIVTSAKTEFYLVAAHHAREAISVENALYFIDKIIYGAINGNSSLLDLLAGTEIYVIPLLNPDGHSIMSWYPWMRKNMAISDDDYDGNFIDELEVVYYWDDVLNESAYTWEDLDDDLSVGEDHPGGVDLNRNYPYAWLGPGSSTTRIDDTYRGPYAGSEPEVQALMNFAWEHDFRYSVSLHSGVKALIMPWGHTSETPPHFDEFNATLYKMKELTDFPTWGEIGGYVVNGEWGDWMLAERDSLAYTIETYGIEVYEGYIWDWFNPPANMVLNNSETVFRASYFLATNPHSFVSNNLPEITQPTIIFDTDPRYLTISWEATDIDDDNLEYSVYYGNNNHWECLARNIIDNIFLVDLATLNDGIYQFKVVVNDGIDRVLIVSPLMELVYRNTGEINYSLNSDQTETIVDVTDNDMNFNRYIIENITILANSSAQPEGINVTLFETDSQSGIFEGLIHFTIIPSDPDYLLVNLNDNVTITYTDYETEEGMKSIQTIIEVNYGILVHEFNFHWITLSSVILITMVVSQISIKQKKKIC